MATKVLKPSQFAKAFARGEMRRRDFALEEGIINSAHAGGRSLLHFLPRYQGDMRRSLRVDEEKKGDIWAQLRVTVPYAAAIEVGTRPFRPPVEPLIGWVGFKFGVTGEDAVSLAWAVAGGIAKNGIRAQFTVYNHLPRFQKIAKREIKRALKKGLPNG